MEEDKIDHMAVMMKRFIEEEFMRSLEGFKRSDMMKKEEEEERVGLIIEIGMKEVAIEVMIEEEDSID